MIAKQIKGKDFYGVLAYNQKKVDKGFGAVLDSNINKGAVVMQTKEFNLIRQLRPNLSKAVYHVSLSLAYDDNLSDQQFSELGRDYLKAMGFLDNQYIIYKHTDQEHAHIHIVANRVMFSGDVVSDSNDFKRSEAVVRVLEKQYKITQLNSVENLESNTLSSGEIEKTLRTGDIPDRLRLQQILINIIQQSNTIDEFIRKLKGKKVKPKFNISKTGNVSGISFEYRNKFYKGSKVKRNLSWNNIKQQINYEQNRDHSVIHAFNSGVEYQRTEDRFTNKREQGNTLKDLGEFTESVKKSTGDLGNHKKTKKSKKLRF